VGAFDGGANKVSSIQGSSTLLMTTSGGGGGSITHTVGAKTIGKIVWVSRTWGVLVLWPESGIGMASVCIILIHCGIAGGYSGNANFFRRYPIFQLHPLGRRACILPMITLHAPHHLALLPSSDGETGVIEVVG